MRRAASRPIAQPGAAGARTLARQPREDSSMTTDPINPDAEAERTSLIIVSDFI